MAIAEWAFPHRGSPSPWLQGVIGGFMGRLEEFADGFTHSEPLLKTIRYDPGDPEAMLLNKRQTTDLFLAMIEAGCVSPHELPAGYGPGGKEENASS